MAQFKFRDDRVVLMPRSGSVSTDPARAWSGMRWIVGPDGNAANHMPDQPSTALEDEIDLEMVRATLGDKGLCLAHAELAWNIAQGLAESNLCSPDLADLCDARKHSFNREVFDAIQAIYTTRSLERTQDPEFVAMAPEQMKRTFNDEMSAACLKTYIAPSDELARFFLLVLEHVRWFTVERFRERGQLPLGLCCIWLNRDEFQVSGALQRYRLPDFRVNC